VSTAAAIATVDILQRDDGIVYEHLERLAIQLAEGIRGLFAKHVIRGVVNQIGPVFHMMFIDRDEVKDFDTFQERNAGLYAKFAELLLDEGVLVRPNGLWYVSAAHDNGHVEATLAAVDQSLARIKEEGD
jgi:glutamate-1-semialdehyde 2,1-aminomutase